MAGDTLSLERWIRLWRNLGAQGDPEPVFCELAERYDEPGRSFHTAAHINHCLDEFDRARTLMIFPPLVEYAIWFHDAVYRCNPGNDEERSAEIAYAVLFGAGLPNMARQIYALIMATRHPSSPITKDARVLSDIDLSSLSLTPTEFDKNSEAVRAEYGCVADHVFFPAAVAFFDELLARKRIYFHDYFALRYEAAARDNLRRYKEQAMRHLSTLGALRCPKCGGQINHPIGSVPTVLHICKI